MIDSNMEKILDSFNKLNIFSRPVIENIKLNYNEYCDRETILKSYPVKVYLEPTQRCDLDCFTCGKSRRAHTADMTMDIFGLIRDQLFETAAEVNFFINGETTLASNFPLMASACSRYTFLPKIFTNAANISDNIIEILAAQGFFVNISFDATDKVLFESIRRGADFNRVVANIDKLRKISTNSAHKRYHLRFSSTLGMHNIHDAPNIIQFAYDHGIRDVLFGFYDAPYDATEMLMADPHVSVGHIRKAIDLADKHKIRFSFFKRVGLLTIERHHNWGDFSLPIDDYAPFYLESMNPWLGDCSYPWLETLVRVNGDIATCCQKQYKMGNICDTDFLKIWNSDAYQTVRSQKNYGRCMGSTCNIARNSIWNGPCFSRKAKHSGFSWQWLFKDFLLPIMRRLGITIPKVIYDRFR